MLRYRFLFEQMVRRELRQKYRGSVLGILWYVVNPLVLMAVYALLFDKLLGAVSIEDYPLFLFVGLIVWMFFSQSLMAAAGSLLEQASLVGKVRFPRETVPASVVTVQLVPFLALLALLVPVAVVVRDGVGAELLLLPLIAACLYCFALGLALVVAVLHAYFRDVQPILGAALLPWFFLTPIFFRVEDLPGLDSGVTETLLRWVNPVAPFVEAVRAVLYDGTAPSAGVLVFVVVAAAVALLGGRALFRRLEGELAVVL